MGDLDSFETLDCNYNMYMILFIRNCVSERWIDEHHIGLIEELHTV
jgi:hypothetical protein